MAHHSTGVAQYEALHGADAVAILDGTLLGAVRPRYHHAHRAFERDAEPQMRAISRPDHSQNGAHGTPAELDRWEDDGGAILPNGCVARQHSSG
jgi:hypothetical protein